MSLRPQAPAPHQIGQALSCAEGAKDLPFVVPWGARQAAVHQIQLGAEMRVGIDAEHAAARKPFDPSGSQVQTGRS